MHPDIILSPVRTQCEAALATIRAAVRRCPDARWLEPVGTWPFAMVAHHALGYFDLYCAHSVRDWTPIEQFHPRGKAHFFNRRTTHPLPRAEVAAYAEACRDRLHAVLAAETAETLAAPSGFDWIPGSRVEVYLYNLRHMSHHAGQLTATLRPDRRNVAWILSGWT